MIQINNTNYRLCCLDTCAISDLFDSLSLFKNFLAFLQKENAVIGIAMNSIIEIKKLPKLYLWFKTIFEKLPTVLLMNSSMIIIEEISNYPNELNNIAFIPLQNKMDYLEHLDKNETYLKTEKYVESDKEGVLKSLLKLRDNFPPDNNGKYSNERIKEFAHTVILQQLDSFFTQNLKDNNLELVGIDTNKFKSLKSQLFITFWKFYLLKDRKERLSDVFDISIVASFAYADFVFTEKNIKNDMIQIQRKGLLYENTIPMTINEL